MGTSKSVDQFTAKMAKAGANITRERRAIVTDGALASKDTVVEAAKRATGGSMRLSNVGRNGSRLGARYDLKGRANPTALVKATGAWQIRDSSLSGGPTSAHTIPKAVGPRGRARKRLLLPDGSIRRRVEHPGSDRADYFAQAQLKMTRTVPTIMATRTVRTVLSAFH